MKDLTISLDNKDLKVLDLLKDNSKLTTSQISKKTGIPITTVHNRIRKMEKLGIIVGYTLKLNYKKLGQGILCYVLVGIIYNLPSGKKVKQEDVAKKIKKFGGVEEVSIVAGGTDVLVKVRAKDIEGLNDFIVRKLRELEGVDKTQTLIVLSSI
jgi:Lrp/AsnC family transcriptional regulator, leucine-responsive regulatory protein